MNKRRLKKKKKWVLARGTVSYSEEFRCTIGRQGFADKVLGSGVIKRSNYVPLTGQRLKREVGKEVKKLRFKNKWLP